MLQRLLSMLGFGYYLPTSSELGINGSNAPETDGQAEVAFLPGKKTAIEAETDQNQDERRQNLTDDSLVWPGKTDTLTYPNDEPVDYRVSLTVTDLEPSYYMRRPAIGGQWQPDQSVLLRPGEETKFEVAFTPPMNADKAVPRNFNYVLTRFDPRRANDAGEIVGEVPLRWVPLPKSNDLKIGANPPVVIMRPWRRAALFNLEFLNRSQLPPSVSLRVQRAESKTKLEEEPEQVATVSQSLPSRTPGVWRLLLPPSAARGSYFATVVGEAKVADGATYPLRLEKPVLVRYVPWLRVAKDWVFLLSGLFLLLLIVWGIPVLKAPVVTFNPEIHLPAGGNKNDLTFSVIPEGESAPIPAPPVEGVGYKATLPARWYGWRPFFGLHPNEPYKFRVVVTPKEKPIYEGFPGTLLTKDERPTQEAPLKAVSLFGGWNVTLDRTVLAPPSKPGAPTIAECDPYSLQPGKDRQIIVRGENFGERGEIQFSQKENVVLKGTILKWDAAQITVRVPNPLTETVGDFNLFVKPGGAEALSSGYPIKVTTGPPPEKPVTPPTVKPPVVTPTDKTPGGKTPGGKTSGGNTQGGNTPPTPPAQPKPDYENDLLTAFKDFFNADYGSDALSDAAKTQATNVLAKAEAYEQHGGNHALSAGLKAVVHNRLGASDDAEKELLLADSHSLTHAFAVAYRQTQGRAWQKKVKEDDFTTLEKLANGDGPTLLKYCADRLVADWYGSKHGADTEKENSVRQKIKDQSLRGGE